MSPNTAAGPAAATTRPPTAGPTARPMLNPAEFRATARASSRPPTSSGMVACQAGALAALPSPSRKVRPRTTAGLASPSTVARHSAAAATSIQDWVASSIRRRSNTSAAAPEGRASSTIGRLMAVWTRATRAAEPETLPICQTAPTLCIQKPTLDTRAAIQRAWNTGWPSGASADGGAGRSGRGRRPRRRSV